MRIIVYNYLKPHDFLFAKNPIVNERAASKKAGTITMPKLRKIPVRTNGVARRIPVFQEGTDVVTYSYYRAMQCVHIVLCALSIVLLLWVFIKYRSKFIFHYNIRVRSALFLILNLEEEDW